MTPFAAAAPVADPETTTRTRRLPPYNVLIENDDDHSMDFVIEVLQKVFGFDRPKAFLHMMKAHEEGEAVVYTGSKEVAELKAEQVQSVREKHHKTGKDLGPLGCRIEPAE